MRGEVQQGVVVRGAVLSGRRCTGMSRQGVNAQSPEGPEEEDQCIALLEVSNRPTWSLHLAIQVEGAQETVCLLVCQCTGENTRVRNSYSSVR